MQLSLDFAPPRRASGAPARLHTEHHGSYTWHRRTADGDVYRSDEDGHRFLFRPVGARLAIEVDRG